MSTIPDTLSPDVCAQIDSWVAKFPSGKQKSAVLMALRIVQDTYGKLDKHVMNLVADYLELSYVAVYEVASFYSLYRFESVGKYHIKVCDSISCKLCGSAGLLQYLEQKLGIRSGETTSDQLFSLGYAECIAACTQAPALIVNDKDYHGNMTKEKVDALIAAYQKEA